MTSPAAAPPLSRHPPAPAPRRWATLLGWSLAGGLLLTAFGLAALPRLGGAPVVSPLTAADPAEQAAIRVLRP